METGWKKASETENVEHDYDFTFLRQIILKKQLKFHTIFFLFTSFRTELTTMLSKFNYRYHIIPDSE